MNPTQVEAAALLDPDGLLPGAQSSDRTGGADPTEVELLQAELELNTTATAAAWNGTQGLPTNATAAADDQAADAASGPV